MSGLVATAWSLTSGVPAAVLLGPRQVGKTTLALTLAESWAQGAVYLDLERPADRLRLDDADAFLRAQGDKLVILDEIHRMPGLFEIFVVDRVFPLETSQGSHCFRPADPADPDGINRAADLPYLIGLGFVDQQFHQGAGVTEEDHRLNPDPQSRCR